MTPRERNIVIALFAVIVLGGGGFAGYTLVISPLQDANAAIEQLQGEIEGTADKEGLESRVDTMDKAVKQLPKVKRESLPPNIDVAKAQYIHVIERLLQQAKIKTGRIPDPRIVERRAPITPELASKKPAYSILEFRLDMDKVDIWELSDFLQEFYKLDLLHQISEINITRENKVTESRAGLKVHLTIEAIILDSVESRSTLFPTILGGTLTPTGKAVAAIAGGAAAEVVTLNPDLEMKYIPAPETSTLATRPRDYSYLAKNDIFYGTLPAERQSGGPTGPRKDDIASYIRLVMLSESTGGTSSAFIMDIASPAKYTVTFSPKDGMKVDRLYNLKSTWKKDYGYDQPQGVLMFSDENASTKRTLKVVAIEDNALIVEDVGKADERIDAKGGGRGPGGNAGGGRGPGGPGGGGGGNRGGAGGNPGGGAGGGARPGGGGAGGGARPAGGPGGARPANPAGPAVAPGAAAPAPGSALAVPLPQGNEKVAADLPAEPVLYRWVVGKSLKDLELAKLPADEARKIMSRVAVAQKPLNE